MSGKPYNISSKQNQQQRIDTLKSKISKVHDLIAETRHIIQPKAPQTDRNLDDVFQSIKINNYTNAKVKIDIIIPSTQEVSKVTIYDEANSHKNRAYISHQEDLKLYKQNLVQEYSQEDNEKTLQRSNIKINSIYQNQNDKLFLTNNPKQRKEKSFKKINSNFLYQKKQVKSSNIENLVQTKILQKSLVRQFQRNDIKKDYYKDEQINQQQKNQIADKESLTQTSAIKILQELKYQNENKQANYQDNSSQRQADDCRYNQNSYTSSSIQQQNTHYLTYYGQGNPHQISQLSHSRGFQFSQSQISKNYFQFTSQKQNQEQAIQNKSPQVLAYDQQYKIYQSPILQQTIYAKRILSQKQNQEQSSQQSDNRAKRKILFDQNQFKTPIAQTKFKNYTLPDTLDSIQKSTNQKVKQENITKFINQPKVQGKKIILPQNKRLKNYSELQKYRRIQTKSKQTNNQQKNKQSKIIQINLADKKAEDLFLKHKAKFLQKLKKGQNHSYGSHYHLNESKLYIKGQSFQKNRKRSLSPRCDQVTNRLYNSRIGAYPCSFYEKFHQEAERQKFQQMVKQYPTVTKYLSQKQRTDFYFNLKKTGTPQTQWMNSLLSYTNKKMKFYFKK